MLRTCGYTQAAGNEHSWKNISLKNKSLTKQAKNKSGAGMLPA